MVEVQEKSSWCSCFKVFICCFILPKKMVLWVGWIVHAIISGVYIGLAITTGNNINGNKDALNQAGWRVIYNSVMSAIVLGNFAVWQFLLLSPAILLKHESIRAGDYLYGSILGMCWVSAFLMLLAGLNLQAADTILPLMEATNSTLGPRWSNSMVDTYRTTFAFSYILVGSFIIMAFILWFVKDAYDSKAKEAAHVAAVVNHSPYPAANPAYAGGLGPAAGTSININIGGTGVSGAPTFTYDTPPQPSPPLPPPTLPPTQSPPAALPVSEVSPSPPPPAAGQV